MEIDPAYRSLPEEERGREIVQLTEDGTVSGRIERTQPAFSRSGIIRDGSEIVDVLPLHEGPNEGARSSAEPES